MFRWHLELALGRLHRLRQGHLLLTLRLFGSIISLGRRLDADHYCRCLVSARGRQRRFRNRHWRLLSRHPLFTAFRSEISGALSRLEEAEHLTGEDVFLCCRLFQNALLGLSVFW